MQRIRPAVPSRRRSPAPAARGFTLVELVVVIVLLGVLAAVALPRFINLGDDAERAVIDDFVGAMYTARNEMFSTMTVENAGYTDENQIGIPAFVQCDANPDLHQGDPSVKWDGAWIGLAGLRHAIFDDPDATACVGSQIQFTTKSGRAVVMNMSGGTITWTATPSY